MLGDSRRLRIAPDVIFEKIEEDMLVLDLQNDQYFAFEGIGIRVWQLISEVGEISGVVARLEREFEVSEAVLREDVRAFVDELIGRGLVVVDEEP